MQRIAVTGARVGDVVCVEPVDLTYRVRYGIVSNRHGRGVLAGTMPRADDDGTEPPVVSVLARVDADGRGRIEPATGRTLRFDLRPFLGLVGVTPGRGHARSSTPPGDYGGNLDIHHLGLGSRLLLPVQVPGAGLYVGDPHFAQGNGEVALTAFEAPLRASLRVTVLDGVDARRLAALLAAPWGETATHTILIGLGDTLDDAMRACVRRALSFVCDVTGADPASALAFLSAAADFEISQAVNFVVGVHCLIRTADLGLTVPLDLVDTVHAFVGPMRVLVEGAAVGPLAGTALAVKDVIDVAGVVTRAGNPTFADGRAPAAANAAAVQALVDGGATVVGKTITDELAYSLSGTNAHDGTPVNVAAPGRIPGGSSAGSAAAVAAGLCDLALGTDTGGSIRVPASYCGILGWRPTHGLVDDHGIVHLARSFDTVGLLARDARVLLAGAELLVADRAVVATPVASSVMVSELLDLVSNDARASLIEESGPDVVALGVDLAECARAFRFLQGREAWTEHGAWITTARPDMDPGIAARFAAASQVTDAEVAWAQPVRDAARRLVVDATAGGRVLLGPTAAGAAPPLDGDPDTHGATRARTLELTCLAGLAGAPVVVLPLARDQGLPLGMACLGAPGSDLALLHWTAERLAA